MGVLEKNITPSLFGDIGTLRFLVIGQHPPSLKTDLKHVLTGVKFSKNGLFIENPALQLENPGKSENPYSMKIKK